MSENYEITLYKVSVAKSEVDNKPQRRRHHVFLDYVLWFLHDMATYSTTVKVEWLRLWQMRKAVDVGKAADANLVCCDKHHSVQQKKQEEDEVDEVVVADTGGRLHPTMSSQLQLEHLQHWNWETLMVTVPAAKSLHRNIDQ